MNNVFKDLSVGEFFDLKGSTHGRNLLQNDETLDMRIEKYGKTAMKDLDFLRFFKGSIVLEEKDSEIQDLLGKTSTFREVIEKDAAFFARTGIIDYSLLLGKLVNPDPMGGAGLDWLENALVQD